MIILVSDWALCSKSESINFTGKMGRAEGISCSLAGIAMLIERNVWHSVIMKVVLSVCLAVCFIFIVILLQFVVASRRHTGNLRGIPYMSRYEQIIRARHLLFFVFGPDIMILNCDEEDTHYKLKALPERELSSNPEDLYDKYNRSFQGASEKTLQQYIQLLKSDYEVWSVWSSGIPPLMTAVFIGLSTSFVAIFVAILSSDLANGRAPSHSISTVINLCIVVSILSLSGMYPLRKVSLKRSKAVLFIGIAEGALASKTTPGHSAGEIIDGKERATVVWVNVDIPSKHFVFHSALSCNYVGKMEETPFKGIGRLKRDGGWLSFDDRRTALTTHVEKFEGYKVIEHC